MKLSVRKRWGFVHVRGGRVLKVAREHQVSVVGYNDSFDKEILKQQAAGSFKDFADDGKRAPFKPRVFDGGWVSTHIGDLAVEIIAVGTKKLLGHAYLTGPAMNLIRYLAVDTEDIGPWFTDAKAKRLMIAPVPDVPQTPDVLVACMMRVKYSGDDIAACHLEAASPSELETMSTVISESYGYAPFDDPDKPALIATTHVLISVRCKKPNHEATLHLQPPRDRSDYAAQPFFHQLIESSPVLEPLAFWVEA